MNYTQVLEQRLCCASFCNCDTICLLQDGLVVRLLTWAREAEEPLRSYATGLLGGAMDIQDVAHAHKEANVHLVGIQQFPNLSSLLFTRMSQCVCVCSMSFVFVFQTNHRAVSSLDCPEFFLTDMQYFCRASGSVF